MNIKETGSYYTPIKLIYEMVKFISNKVSGKDLLEPSAGDGRFIDELIKLKFNIDSVELIKEKSNYISNKFNSENVTSINEDFMDYCFRCKKKYDIIIGNPPYINKKLLNEEQKERSRELYREFNLPYATFSNLWVSFILGAIRLIKEHGTIFFILPHEFLQVEYSKSLRNFLEEKFKAIEIFEFKESIFKDIQQDVCLVYMSNDTSESKPYIKYNIVDGVDICNPASFNKIMRNKPLDKWSNSIISDDEIELIKRLSNNCIKIKEFGEMAPGLVTGANDYFILEDKFIKAKRIKNYVIPIISKSSYIANKLIFKEDDFLEISKQQKKVYLLKLNDYNYNKLPKGIKDYLLEGEKKRINTRHKCSKRKPWYSMPNGKTGDIVFFKRYDIIPRLIINRYDSYTTDIGYNISVKKEYHKESIAFCFYNSLSLIMCEFNGRFYGGGVEELTPNEFREVVIPYKVIEEKYINNLDNMFRTNEKIDSIIEYVNKMVLKDIATKEEIDILEDIRNRYIKRRKKQ